MKRVVDSLKPEYEGKIKFAVANISTEEGKHFAQYHQSSFVTLLLFDGEGQRLGKLEGVQTADYLRRAFDRAFKLKS